MRLLVLVCPLTQYGGGHALWKMTAHLTQAITEANCTSVEGVLDLNSSEVLLTTAVDLLVIAKKVRLWTNCNLLAPVSKKGSHCRCYSLNWVAVTVAFVVNFDSLAEGVNDEVRTGAGRRLSPTFQRLVAACHSTQSQSP